ncbi:MAG TPA: hypothetical protein VM912_05370 [Terriglobales bacterium]|nr:hypothetical protein [Terriglobales bacterium]
MGQKGQFETADRGAAISCADFDALLSDALDGVLSIAAQQRFDTHRRQCATCGPLFSEASAGLNWLQTLEQVEPPANLVHNILSATTVQTNAALAAAPKLGWKERLAAIANDVLVPIRAMVRQPRMAMTGGMALFSISLTLNVMGVKLSDIRHLDLRPSAIKMKYYETSSRVVKYYENIRLVYEVESRLQELKRATTNADEQEQPRRPSRDKTENKNDRERKQNFYSMDRQNMLLANRSTKELKSGSNWDFNSGVNNAADPNTEPPAVAGRAVEADAVLFSTPELSCAFETSGESLRSLAA